MSKNNDNNTMMVFAAELIEGEKGACLTSRVRHVHKDNFLQEAYDIIHCDLVTFMHKNLHKLYKAIKMGLLGERESA